MLNKDFNEYVYKRCGTVLSEDDEYKKLQSDHVDAIKQGDSELSEELSCKMECRAEELCYMQGFKDAMELINLK